MKYGREKFKAYANSSCVYQLIKAYQKNLFHYDSAYM